METGTDDTLHPWRTRTGSPPSPLSRGKHLSLTRSRTLSLPQYPEHPAHASSPKTKILGRGIGHTGRDPRTEEGP